MDVSGGREFLPGEVQPPRPRFGDLVLRTGPNWTAIGFIGMLGALHLGIGARSLTLGHWAGYMSLIFGTLLLALGVGVYLFRSEMRFHGISRRLYIRTGIGRFCCVRSIRFDRIRGVRLTMEAEGRRPSGMIELLCDGEDLPCPPVSSPRQQALFLALLLGVPLTKVMPGDADSAAPTEKSSVPQSRLA